MNNTHTVSIHVISDTHNMHEQLDLSMVNPETDILIHAGDALTQGKHPEEVLAFAHWWNKLPVRQKYMVPGNHDRQFEPQSSAYWREYRAMVQGLKVDQSVQVDSAQIHFSPWSRKFHNWAWNRTELELANIYSTQVPWDTNIWVSHQPPFGTLDINQQGNRCGSTAMADYIASNMPKVQLVIFGHIHESRGYVMDRDTGITYVNASNAGIPYDNFTPTPITITYDSANNKVLDIDDHRGR